jgi:hypothetical protein
VAGENYIIRSFIICIIYKKYGSSRSGMGSRMDWIDLAQNRDR